MTTIKKALPPLTLIFSLAALALVLARNASSPSPEEEAALRRAELLEERVRSLEESLVSLTRRQRRMEMETLDTSRTGNDGHRASPSPAAAEEGEPAHGAEVAAVLEPVVAELERKQESLEQELFDLGVFDHFQKVQEEIVESYEVALNPELSTKRRLGALPVLKEANRIDEEVVRAMIALWDEDDSPRVGYYVMENLEGVTDPALRDRILESLQDEEIPKLRGRAIETLAPMMPDPHVEDWLIYLHENDPEPWVREQAAGAVRQSKGAR